MVSFAGDRKKGDEDERGLVTLFDGVEDRVSTGLTAACCNTCFSMSSEPGVVAFEGMVLTSSDAGVDLGEMEWRFWRGSSSCSWGRAFDVVVENGSRNARAAKAVRTKSGRAFLSGVLEDTMVVSDYESWLFGAGE